MDRRFLRPGWIAGHLLVFLAFLTCLRLGWWQWDRTHDADGTAQNLGYALLWPAFGVAFIYMWVRFLHLELLKDAEDDEETDRALQELLDADSGSEHPPAVDGSAGTGPTAGSTSEGPDDGIATEDPAAVAAAARAEHLRRRQRPSQAVTISVAMVGEDDDDDPELTAYNQALAALAEEDRRRAR